MNILDFLEGCLLLLVPYKFTFFFKSFANGSRISAKTKESADVENSPQKALQLFDCIERLYTLNNIGHSRIEVYSLSMDYESQELEH